MLFHTYHTNPFSVFLLCFSPPGSTVEQFPWYLWWAAADVHCSGGGWICQGHPGEHAQHSGHWPVYGCSQTAIYCSYSWKPPLLFSGWGKCEGFCFLFFIHWSYQNNHTRAPNVHTMLSFSSPLLSPSLSLSSESRSILLPVVLHHIHLHLRQQRELLICSGILSSIFSIIKTSSMVGLCIIYIQGIYDWKSHVITKKFNWISEYNITLLLKYIESYHCSCILLAETLRHSH